MQWVAQMTVKRFIAGAVCPRCAEMDKILAYQKDGINYRKCVSCEYADEMQALEPSELATRVTPKIKVEQSVQPLKFYRAPKKNED
jgi:hypothetical protein